VFRTWHDRGFGFWYQGDTYEKKMYGKGIALHSGFITFQYVDEQGKD
jgi:hypothetical protein